jgi:hypothetical protein
MGVLTIDKTVAGITRKKYGERGNLGSWVVVEALRIMVRTKQFQELGDPGESLQRHLLCRVINVLIIHENRPVGQRPEDFLLSVEKP